MVLTLRLRVHFSAHKLKYLLVYSSWFGHEYNKNIFSAKFTHAEAT